MTATADNAAAAATGINDPKLNDDMRPPVENGQKSTRGFPLLNRPRRHFLQNHRGKTLYESGRSIRPAIMQKIATHETIFYAVEQNISVFLWQEARSGGRLQSSVRLDPGWNGSSVVRGMSGYDLPRQDASGDNRYPDRPEAPWAGYAAGRS